MKFTLRRILAAALSLTLLGGTLAGCGKEDTTMESEAAETAVQGVTFTDALGTEVQIESWDTVVSLYGSFAETWTLAGGKLAGVTEDAIEERNMELGEDVAMIGSVKSPSLESILAVNPDFVILSADIATQVDMQQALTEAGIPHAYFRVDTFEDYLSMLELFCQMTGRSDLYEQNGALVEQKITKIKELTAGEEGPTGLLIRAFSTGAKAKGADNQTGYIMEDLGVDNIVARHESLLEDLSIEEIITEDPDLIFITTMGAEDAALAALESGIMSNPAWEGLTAVQQDRCYVLPKDLFHYKPIARWAESHAYMAKLLYPELAEDIDAIMA